MLILVFVLVIGGLVGLTTRLATHEAAAGGGSQTTATAGEQDFQELAEVDPSIVNEAQFISVNIVRQGVSTSYMLGAGDQGFSALAQSVAQAEDYEQVIGDTGCSMTFGLSDRRMVSFDLDVEQWLLGRGGKAFRPGPEFASAFNALEERGK